MTAVPIPDDGDDDADWWELDSSESIPATMARPGWGAAAALASAHEAPVRVGHRGPLAEAVEPGRPVWVIYASISAGCIVGVIVLIVVFSMLSHRSGPEQKSVGDQPASGSDASTASITEESQPKPDTGPATVVNGPEAHQAVIDRLTRAYNDIADGYAQIADAASIPRGEERITRGVEQLKAAAERGRSLPPLQPDEYAALTGSRGPSLLGAVDRVIQQLRRLKATPGIKSDFDRLIDAYTRARQEIEREMQSSVIGSKSQGPNFGRPPAPSPPRVAPPGPPRRLRGRR